jgi:hypothetical protein
VAGWNVFAGVDPAAMDFGFPDCQLESREAGINYWGFDEGCGHGD